MKCLNMFNVIFKYYLEYLNIDWICIICILLNFFDLFFTDSEFLVFVDFEIVDEVIIVEDI